MTSSGQHTTDGIRTQHDESGAERVVAARESGSGRTSVSADAGTGKGAKRSGAKKQSVKNTAAKKTAAKKTAAKKTAAKKTAAKTSAAKASAASEPSASALDKLAVRTGESPWTEAELADVRELLTTEAARLRDEISEAEEGIAEMLRDSVDAGGEDQADTGSKTFEREHEMSLAASHREILGQTERALTRIDNGTYGVCESCGKPIGKARLQAFPRATLCMACKEREERR